MEALQPGDGHLLQPLDKPVLTAAGLQQPWHVKLSAQQQASSLQHLLVSLLPLLCADEAVYKLK